MVTVDGDTVFGDVDNTGVDTTGVCGTGTGGTGDTGVGDAGIGDVSEAEQALNKSNQHIWQCRVNWAALTEEASLPKREQGCFLSYLSFERHR